MTQISNVRISNVLKRVLAAEDTEATPLNKEDLNKDEGRSTPVTQYFYFYEVNTPKGVNFSSLPELVIHDPYRISEILNSGWSGQYGDHFKWTGIVVKTNVLGDGVVSDKGFVAYYSELSESGSRVSGTDKIVLDNNLKNDPKYKDAGLLPIESFIKNNNVFITGKEVPNFIYLEKKPGFGFYNEASSNLEKSVQEILSKNFSGSANSFDQWKGKIFSDFRMWVDSVKELRYPDLGRPTDYLGDPKSIAALEKKVRDNSNLKDYSIKTYSSGKDNSFPEEEKRKTLLDKNEQGTFEPVDEQAPITSEGEKNKYSSEKQTGNKRDYSKKPYGGGFSIMQDLVKDQKHDMKIREAAQRVIMASMSGPGSMGSGSGPNPATVDKTTKSYKNLNVEVKKYNDLTKSADESGENGVMEDPSGLNKQASEQSGGC